MNRRILLLEPNYHNKYPPIGLMKIAMYHRLQGDKVVFFKGEFNELVLSELTTELIERLNDLDKELGIGRDWKDYTPEVKNYIRLGKVAPDSIMERALSDNLLATLWLKSYREDFRNGKYYRGNRWDIVYVTTLFTFYWDITIKTIEFAKKICKNVRVGGVMASVIPEKVFETTGIKPHVGCLNIPKYEGDDDLPSEYAGMNIDDLPLDYSILEEIDYRYPASDAYYGYTTRGCVNKCPFCVVPIIEPEYKNRILLKEKIKKTEKLFGKRRDLLLLDNNVFASDKFNDIIDEIRGLGFGKGARYVPSDPLETIVTRLKDGWNDRAYIRLAVNVIGDLTEKLKGDDHTRVYSLLINKKLLHNYTATKENILSVYDEIKSYFKKYHPQKQLVRFVDFNQGVDARLATPEKIAKLSEINIRPLRIAFDNWSIRKDYVNAVKLASENGISHMSNYLLYNFNDKPGDLYRRLLLNIDLCDELGVNIYSFPMKYHPIMDEKWLTNRDYVSPHWKRKSIRTVQAVLNSTHGKIGKGRTFFFKAFGRSESEFLELTRMPESFIIMRWDAELSGLTDKWRNAYEKLNDEDRIFSDSIIDTNEFDKDRWKNRSENVRNLLNFYLIKRNEIPRSNEDKKTKAVEKFLSVCPTGISNECRVLLNSCVNFGN